MPAAVCAAVPAPLQRALHRPPTSPARRSPLYPFRPRPAGVLHYQEELFFTGKRKHSTCGHHEGYCWAEVSPGVGAWGLRARRRRRRAGCAASGVVPATYSLCPRPPPAPSLQVYVPCTCTTAWVIDHSCGHYAPSNFESYDSGSHDYHSSHCSEHSSGPYDACWYDSSTHECDWWASSANFAAATVADDATGSDVAADAVAGDGGSGGSGGQGGDAEGVDAQAGDGGDGEQSD